MVFHKIIVYTVEKLHLQYLTPPDVFQYNRGEIKHEYMPYV